MDAAAQSVAVVLDNLLMYLYTPTRGFTVTKIILSTDASEHLRDTI